MDGARFKDCLRGGTATVCISIDEVRSRVGEPRSIHLSPRWCKRTGRDLVVLTFDLDDGEARVLGFMGFIDGEQALMDGWIDFDERSKDRAARLPKSPMGLPTPGLFDEPVGPIEPVPDRAPESPGGAAGRQNMLGDW